MDACAGNVTDVCKIGQELLMSVRNFSQCVHDCILSYLLSIYICVLTNVRKLQSGWGSPPDPDGGAYSAPPCWEVTPPGHPLRRSNPKSRLPPEFCFIYVDLQLSHILYFLILCIYCQYCMPSMCIYYSDLSRFGVVSCSSRSVICLHCGYVGRFDHRYIHIYT